MHKILIIVVFFVALAPFSQAATTLSLQSGGSVASSPSGPMTTAGSTPALPAGESNLCGSDVSKYLVPDYVCFDAQGERVPYAGCGGGRRYDTLVRYKVDFSGACKQHDLCYGKVGATKSQCDTDLYQNMKTSCRTQLPSELGEKASRSCYETALLFNDVVRGQATRRFGIWMTQQVPFTGKSGCDAFVSAQRAAGNVNATCAQPQPQPGGRDTAEPKVSVAPNSAAVAEKEAQQVGYAHLEKMVTKCNGLSYLKSRYLGNNRKEITDIREYKGAPKLVCHERPESNPKKSVEWSCLFEVNVPQERMNYLNEGWTTETPMPLMFGVTKAYGQWQVNSSFQKVACNEVQGLLVRLGIPLTQVTVYGDE